MRRLAVRALALLVAGSLGGCSVLFDPSRYREDGGERAEAGVDAAGMDAAAIDAAGIDAAGVDAGPPPDGGPGDSGVVLAPVPADQFCDEFSRANCAWGVRCAGFTGCTFGPPVVSRDRCVTELREVEAGRVGYDPLAAAACIEASRASVCGVGPPFFRFATLCPGVLIPLQRTGDDCYYASTPLSNNACAEGVCTYTAGACPGVCAPYRALGASCDGIGLRCDPAVHYCSTDMVCAVLPGFGEPCTGPCMAGLLCLPEGDGGSACGNLQAAGGPCDTLGDCQYPLGCTDGECATVVAEGEACRDPTNCPAGLRCGQADFSGALTCQAPYAAGDECVDFALCPEGTQCLYEETSSTSYRCLAWAQVGEPCGPDCQPGLWCRHVVADDAGTCQEPGGVGAACLAPEGYTLWDACAAPAQCMDDGLCHLQGAADGDPCSWNSPSTCADGLWCEQETNVCRAPVADGAACNAYWGRRPCMAGSYCECEPDCNAFSSAQDPAEVCTPLRANGALCLVSTQCASSICYSPDATPATCRATYPTGAGCVGPPPEG